MVMRKNRDGKYKPSVPLKVGTWVTFRAELMPGRDTIQRTFEVTRVLRNQRVELDQLEGQHSVSEFERISKNGKVSTEDLIEQD